MEKWFDLDVQVVPSVNKEAELQSVTGTCILCSLRTLCMGEEQQ